MSSTKIGIRRGREIAQRLFYVCVVAFAMGVVLLALHGSMVKVVVGVLLIAAAVAGVIRYSKKPIV